MDRHRRNVEWRLSQSTYNTFMELAGRYNELPQDSDEAAAIVDDILALGHPRGTDIHDLIYLTITTETSRASKPLVTLH